LNEKIIFSDELTDKQKTMIGDVLGVSDFFMIYTKRIMYKLNENEKKNFFFSGM